MSTLRSVSLPFEVAQHLEWHVLFLLVLLERVGGIDAHRKAASRRDQRTGELSAHVTQTQVVHVLLKASGKKRNNRWNFRERRQGHRLAAGDCSVKSGATVPIAGG